MISLNKVKEIMIFVFFVHLRTDTEGSITNVLQFIAELVRLQKLLELVTILSLFVGL